MSETVLTIEDASRCLPDLVERVRVTGESAVLVKSGRPLARIVPVTADERTTDDLIAFLRRWRIEHAEPDEQLAGDIARNRTAVQPPHNPWD